MRAGDRKQGIIKAWPNQFVVITANFVFYFIFEDSRHHTVASDILERKKPGP